MNVPRLCGLSSMAALAPVVESREEDWSWSGELGRGGIGDIVRECLHELQITGFPAVERLICAWDGAASPWRAGRFGRPGSKFWCATTRGVTARSISSRATRKRCASWRSKPVAARSTAHRAKRWARRNADGYAPPPGSTCGASACPRCRTDSTSSRSSCRGAVRFESRTTGPPSWPNAPYSELCPQKVVGLPSAALLVHGERATPVQPCLRSNSFMKSTSAETPASGMAL